jgi:hypothetical protein
LKNLSKDENRTRGTEEKLTSKKYVTEKICALMTNDDKNILSYPHQLRWNFRIYVG